jgi:hypothetical protein
MDAAMPSHAARRLRVKPLLTDPLPSRPHSFFGKIIGEIALPAG